MSNIIQITAALRVRDYDANQYVLERLSGVNKKTGEDVYSIIAYCGSPKSASTAALRELCTIAIDKARKVECEIWQENPAREEIEGLPDKPRKVRGHE